jgi:hypothetical protein
VPGQVIRACPYKKISLVPVLRITAGYPFLP